MVLVDVLENDHEIIAFCSNIGIKYNRKFVLLLCPSSSTNL
jgi:hypothetical protein